MDILLNDDEARVLGCLMEKKMATPDYYPLSLNALINACNQKSNRNPVVSFNEDTVMQALNGLMEQHLANQSNVSRVPKYEEFFSKRFNLIAAEEAIICILLVRGPQTAGEIRSRTERLYAFSSLEAVFETISNLEEMNMVIKLPRQPGRKESRYAHFLGGEPSETQSEPVLDSAAATMPLPDEDGPIRHLQEQINELRDEIQDLKTTFFQFKSQFD